MTKEYVVEGMNCQHCRASVEKAISAVEGVEKVEVDLPSGKAYVSGTASPEAIEDAVTKAGFSIRH